MGKFGSAIQLIKRIREMASSYRWGTYTLRRTDRLTEKCEEVKNQVKTYLEMSFAGM